MKKLILLTLCVWLPGCIDDAQADPIRVLMIDAGVPQKEPTFNDVRGHDVSLLQHLPMQKHSNLIYQGIIAGIDWQLKPACSNLKVDWCVFLPGESFYHHCLKQAVLGHYNIVNMSLAGDWYDIEEEKYIEEIAKTSLIVIADGNDSLYKRAYPAAFAKTKSGPIFAMSAIDKNGKRLPSSNYDNLTIDFLGKMMYHKIEGNIWNEVEGTSISAALYTNHLIRQMCPINERSRNGKTF